MNLPPIFRLVNGMDSEKRKIDGSIDINQRSSLPYCSECR